MTDRQIELVKMTWKTLRGVSPALVGDVFYSKLFLSNPGLRHMFPASMDGQYKKLMDMLGVIVARLERLESLLADIEKLAQRHVQYGVKQEHYKLVGEALIWTLQQGLGRDWNNEVKEAWTTCFQLLSDTMIRASGYNKQEPTNNTGTTQPGW